MDDHLGFEIALWARYKEQISTAKLRKAQWTVSMKGEMFFSPSV